MDGTDNEPVDGFWPSPNLTPEQTAAARLLQARGVSNDMLNLLFRCRTCAHCREEFIEFENIGQYRCQYHVGQYNVSGDGQFYKRFQWECCGKTKDGKGCVKGDHLQRAYPWAIHEIATFSKNLWVIVGRKSKAKCRHKDNKVFIPRLDYQEAEARQLYGKSQAELKLASRV